MNIIDITIAMKLINKVDKEVTKNVFDDYNHNIWDTVWGQMRHIIVDQIVDHLLNQMNDNFHIAKISATIRTDQLKGFINATTKDCS